jgi:serine/threonine-protein kinase
MPPERQSRESLNNAHQDALKALALAPDLAEGHLALASYFDYGTLDFTRENEEFERALALAPGNARILRDYGEFAVMMGRQEAGIAAARRAVSLDPLNDYAHVKLGGALFAAHQFDAAVAAFQEALAIDPRVPYFNTYLGLAYYAMGDVQGARESCEKGNRST